MAEAGRCERVLEIGPGKGILTQFVAAHWPDFMAIDADQDMVTWLEAHHPEWTKHILLGDFLQMPMDPLFQGKEFGLIGNFPYNISSQILFRMLEHRERIPIMVGMFQREVARRIISGPGSKEYGILSVLTQLWYEGTYLFSVSPGCFDPPPKVQSGVIRLMRKETVQLLCREKDFVSVVKTSFGQRRKMLRNSLKEMVKDPEMLALPIFTMRPEQLGLDDFVELTLMLFPVE